MFGCDNVDSYVLKKTNDHINFKISGHKVENRIHKSLRDKQILAKQVNRPKQKIHLLRIKIL